MKSNKHAGQFKLRGKKTALLSCKCCTVENWKQECMEKDKEKEKRLFSLPLDVVDVYEEK